MQQPSPTINSSSKAADMAMESVADGGPMLVQLNSIDSPTRSAAVGEQQLTFDVSFVSATVEPNHDRPGFVSGPDEESKLSDSFRHLLQSNDLPDGFTFVEPVCRSGCSGVEMALPKVASFDKQHSTDLSTPPLGVLKSTKSGDSVLFSDNVQRPTPTVFTGTRHQSYGNLGVSGIAGLSSTSATLAFLPLRAGGDTSLKAAIPATSSTVASTCVGSPPVVSSPHSSYDLTQTTTTSSITLVSNSTTTTTSIGSPPVWNPHDVTDSTCCGSRPKTTCSAVSGTAAAIWDRRSSFFSEPPKPISLPTRSVSQFSVSRDGQQTLSGLDDIEPLIGFSSSSASSNAAANGLSSFGVRSDESRWMADFSSFSSSTRSSFSQQPPPAQTPAIQPPCAEPSLLRLDPPVTYAIQRDASPQLRDLSVYRGTDTTITMSTSSSLGCSVKTDSDESGISVWCHSSPQYSSATLEPSSQTDSSFFDFGESSACVTEALSALHQKEQFCEAFAQAMPSGASSSFVTPAKVGNIQKLKAFFGETTPRIMEAKTDSKTSNDTQAAAGASSDTTVDAESPDTKKSSSAVQTGDSSATSRPLSGALLDKAAMTAKGKKMATWVLASRHHSSHPQLPSTRPKKSLTDREPSLSPKQKEHRKWKGKVVRTFKRHSSSSAVVTSDPPSQPDENTGTFGVPLECCYPSVMNELVPLVVEVCTQVVEERGIENQGIYRVPGNSVAINILVDELNRDPESACMDNEKWQDVNSVSSLLKLFFRKLPDSLITDELYEFVIAANRTENCERRMLKLKKLLHELPEHNFETFRFLAQHLNKVTTREEINKMDAHNLAIVFGPTLVRPQDNSMVVMVRDMADQSRVVESIILHCDWFFSSWDEDVNVPVDEQATDVPIMNQQLLAKAESLVAAADAISSAPTSFVSSLLHAANKKIRQRDKSRSADHDTLSGRSSTGSSGVSSPPLSGTNGHQPHRAMSDDARMEFEIRHYPAYRFDGDCTGRTTENSKPSVLRRVSLSYESLRGSARGGLSRRIVSKSGVVLPGTYAAMYPRTADPDLMSTAPAALTSGFSTLPRGFPVTPPDAFSQTLPRAGDHLPLGATANSTLPSPSGVSTFPRSAHTGQLGSSPSAQSATLLDQAEDSVSAMTSQQQRSTTQCLFRRYQPISETSRVTWS